VIEGFALKNLKKEAAELFHGWIGALVFALQSRAITSFGSALLRVRSGQQGRREQLRRGQQPLAKQESAGNLGFFIRELIMAYKDLLLYTQALSRTYAPLTSLDRPSLCVRAMNEAVRVDRLLEEDFSVPALLSRAKTLLMKGARRSPRRAARLHRPSRAESRAVLRRLRPGRHGDAAQG